MQLILSPEDPLRMPTLVIICTCCSVGVRAGGWSSC